MIGAPGLRGWVLGQETYMKKYCGRTTVANDECRVDKLGKWVWKGYKGCGFHVAAFL